MHLPARVLMLIVPALCSATMAGAQVSTCGDSGAVTQKNCPTSSGENVIQILGCAPGITSLSFPANGVGSGLFSSYLSFYRLGDVNVLGSCPLWYWNGGFGLSGTTTIPVKIPLDVFGPLASTVVQDMTNLYPAFVLSWGFLDNQSTIGFVSPVPADQPPAILAPGKTLPLTTTTDWLRITSSFVPTSRNKTTLQVFLDASNVTTIGGGGGVIQIAFEPQAPDTVRRIGVGIANAFGSNVFVPSLLQYTVLPANGDPTQPSVVWTATTVIDPAPTFSLPQTLYADVTPALVVPPGNALFVKVADTDPTKSMSVPSTASGTRPLGPAWLMPNGSSAWGSWTSNTQISVFGSPVTLLAPPSSCASAIPVCRPTGDEVLPVREEVYTQTVPASRMPSGPIASFLAPVFNTPTPVTQGLFTIAPDVPNSAPLSTGSAISRTWGSMTWAPLGADRDIVNVPLGTPSPPPLAVSLVNAVGSPFTPVVNSVPAPGDPLIRFGPPTGPPTTGTSTWTLYVCPDEAITAARLGAWCLPFGGSTSFAAGSQVEMPAMTFPTEVRIRWMEVVISTPLPAQTGLLSEEVVDGNGNAQAIGTVRSLRLDGSAQPAAEFRACADQPLGPILQAGQPYSLRFTVLDPGPVSVGTSAPNLGPVSAASLGTVASLAASTGVSSALQDSVVLDSNPGVFRWRPDSLSAWQPLSGSVAYRLIVEPVAATGAPRTPPGPGAFRLEAAPNPAHGAVALSWSGGSGETVLEITDLSGRRVRLERLHDGVRRWTWDGRDGSGRALPAGVFYARAMRGASAVALCRLELVR